MLKNLLKQPTIKLLPQCITVGLEEPCRGGDNPPDAANGDSTHLPSSLWALLASHDLQHMKNLDYFRYIGPWGHPPCP